MISARTRIVWQAVFFLCLPGLVAAHVNKERLFPFFYLSDEIVEGIRVDDGSVDDWLDLVGEPSLTLLDFTEKLGNAPLDPSDLDFRIWLAWHDDPARIYGLRGQR